MSVYNKEKFYNKVSKEQGSREEEMRGGRK